MAITAGDREYGEHMADVYDDLLDVGSTDVDDAVSFLGAHAGGRRILELGVGTGRLALPLAERGFAVTGIDTSTAMLDRLRAADPKGAVVTHTAGMSDFALDATFDMAFVACSTFYFLRTAAAQRSCLTRVAAHLRAGGRLVVEAFVPKPDFSHRPSPVYLSRSALPGPGLMIAGADHSWPDQRLSGAKVHLDGSTVRLFPYDLRYVWLSELDLMAELAGLTLEARYGDYLRKPLTSGDEWHVSVYRTQEAR
jgi:SAM-dependent methyltransferase